MRRFHLILFLCLLSSCAHFAPAQEAEWSATARLGDKCFPLIATNIATSGSEAIDSIVALCEGEFTATQIVVNVAKLAAKYGPGLICGVRGLWKIWHDHLDPTTGESLCKPQACPVEEITPPRIKRLDYILQHSEIIDAPPLGSN